VRRPRSVHGPLERERVEEGDCVFAAVEGEVAVVAVDHRDARAHEPGDGEDGYACAEREGGVGVAQVIEAADRLDPGLDLRRPPVLASEDPEVDPAAAHVRKQDRVVRHRQPVERFERLRLERHRPRA